MPDCASSTLRNVSPRYEGDPDKPVLAEEDDWFATPFQEPSEADEVVWQEDAPEPPPQYVPDGLGQRQAVVVLAVVAIVAVIAIGVLVVRSIGGSGDTTAATTATVPTTPAETTPAATTPTSTTPTTSPTLPTTPSASAVPTGTTLRPGASGAAVTSLQQALTQLGFEPGTADGSYGPATTAAVTAFQNANGLTEDGIAGPATIAAINSAIAG